MKPSQRNRLLRSLTVPFGIVMLGGLSLTPAWAGIFPGLQQEACMADAYIAKGGSLAGGSLVQTRQVAQVGNGVHRLAVRGHGGGRRCEQRRQI